MSSVQVERDILHTIISVEVFYNSVIYKINTLRVMVTLINKK
jgi:hypothetical protein